MIPFDLLAKRFRYVVPHEQVHPERQVAFLECLPQVADTPNLLGRGEYHEVEIGLRARCPRCAGTIDPGGRSWQMASQQRQDCLALLGGDVDGPFYSHVSPVIVWYRPMASSMKAGINSKQACAFWPS